MNKVEKKIELAGRTLSLRTGGIAERANRAVLASYGETVVLVTATEDEPREGINYLPLRVDYVERLYAGGKIKTSRFVKREGRPSDEAIIAGRLVDHAIRPLFPDKLRRDIQIVITLLSVDGENDPVLLSLVGASAALASSNIPWNGPLGGVRVGLDPKKQSPILNPTRSEREFSPLDLVVAGKKDKVLMLDGEASEIEEERFLEAISFALTHISRVVDFVSEFAGEMGAEKLPWEEKAVEEELRKEILDYIRDHFKEEILSGKVEEKEYWREELHQVFEGRLKKGEMDNILDEAIKDLVRGQILDQGVRLDGRKPQDIRPLEMGVGLLPRTHGSALFRRGDTQALTVTTLGSTSLEQLIQGPLGEETKRYIHHYYFPPYSTGETAPLRYPSRREIGHSALAEKAVRPVIPPEEEFPYALRLVSEILSSAGSTSMAATCGSTLSLMDAGVPIKAPVAGVAVGLVKEKGKSVVLTDIGPLEDQSGDMDLKIAGTRKGITAVQMDVKKELDFEDVEKGVKRAREGRMKILEKMSEVIAQPRAEISKLAPRITQLKIDPEKIGKVIGPGGKVINSIMEETGVAVDIKDDGTVLISSPEPQGAKKAKEWIENIVGEKKVKVGDVFTGKVTNVTDFGAFVEIFPGKDGLVHISELDHRFVTDPHEVVKKGDRIKVKVIGIDEEGKISLSRKALL